MWNQKSRILWLSKRDGNTKFFHSRASHRFKKNSILGINDSHGLWRENHEEIAEVLLGFYNELFTSSNPVLSPAVLDQIPQVVSNDMNQQLICKFEKWEVAATLKQMAPMKAPKPHGMPHLFYQHFWPMVEGDVTQSVLLAKFRYFATTNKSYLYNSYPKKK